MAIVTISTKGQIVIPKDKGATILDAGGGTRIWSIELAKIGYLWRGLLENQLLLVVLVGPNQKILQSKNGFIVWS